jgi:nucleoside-diphosphate-sugar epimerase
VTLAVVGGTGFIGSSVIAHCRAVGLPVACIAAPRIVAGAGPVGERAASWRRSNAAAFERLCRALEPFDVVVNAAGMAAPGAAEHPSLFGANAVLPLVVAEAAAVVGAGRLVHVSTAAVQGRLDPLDESSRRFPLSP